MILFCLEDLFNSVRNFDVRERYSFDFHSSSRTLVISSSSTLLCYSVHFPLTRDNLICLCLDSAWRYNYYE